MLVRLEPTRTWVAESTRDSAWTRRQKSDRARCETFREFGSELEDAERFHLMARSEARTSRFSANLSDATFTYTSTNIGRPG